MNKVLAIVPSRDGTGVYFRHIADYLSRDIKVVFLDSPGLYDDCEPFETVEALAQYYLECLSPAKGDRYRILGWSFGSMIALHMVWLLEGTISVDLASIDPVWVMGSTEKWIQNGRRTGQACPPRSYPEQRSVESRLGEAFDLAQARYRPREVHSRGLYLLSSLWSPGDITQLRQYHRVADVISVMQIPGDHLSMLDGVGARLIGSAISAF
jgi:thioesterase domain-containing protein